MDSGEMAEHRTLVLVVDDNDEHRSMYMTFLRYAGCKRFVAKGADPERIVQTIREVLESAA
jgi:hypothetical protein